jgi:hypothetical protein
MAGSKNKEHWQKRGLLGYMIKFTYKWEIIVRKLKSEVEI